MNEDMLLKFLEFKVREIEVEMNRIKNATEEELIELLNDVNIKVNEKQIIEYYENLQNIDKVLICLQDQNKLIMNALDERHYSLVLQVFYSLIHQTVTKNYDIETLNDPFYFEVRISQVENTPKKLKQEKILGIIKSTVAYAKMNDLSKLIDVYRIIDFNVFLQENIKYCHNRDKNFKQIIKDLYDTFEDVDHSIYKI